MAITASIALVAAAPFVGVARSALRSAFPGRFSLIVYGAIGAIVAAGVAIGLRRMSEGRAWRSAAMAVAVAVAVGYVLATGSNDPAIRAVESFHFVQYGVISYLFYRVWRTTADWSCLAVPAIAAFIVGVAEEGYQWFLPARVGELRDVALNAVAITCGLLFSVGLEPPLALRHTRLATHHTRRAAALAALALAAFVHVVHLGVIVDGPGSARFESRYSADELERLAADRLRAWQAAPPLVRPDRFSREDQYTTEGLQHVQARNAAWDTGDAATAWHENAILERYFAPVLDTPSYVSASGHRWSPDHRADAERRAGTRASEPFVSRAYPYPIFTWSPILLWAVTLCLAAALWGRLGRAFAEKPPLE